MKVKVQVSSYFKKYIDNTELEIEVSDSSNAEELIRLLGIPLEQVGFVTVNNQKADMNMKLTDGQKIGIYPYIIGG